MVTSCSLWTWAYLPPLQSCLEDPAMFEKFNVFGSRLRVGMDGTHPFTLNLMVTELNTPATPASEVQAH